MPVIEKGTIVKNQKTPTRDTYTFQTKKHMTIVTSDRYATLKAWCKWKRDQWAYLNRTNGFIPEEEDEDHVKDIEDLISEVGTLKARLEQFSVHGSDDCLNCDTGRITVYAKKRWCLECLSKKPTT